jgi:hypothetical protein
LASGLQVTDRNILVGLEDRLGLLHHLGQVLQTRSDFFGGAVPRPGNLMGTQKDIWIQYILVDYFTNDPLYLPFFDTT